MPGFANKNILVLGGSRGIGAAIVRRFAGDGAKVAFTYAGSKDAAETLAAETGAEAIQTDSADRDAVIATVAQRGALDVLVINAGIAMLGDPLTFDPDEVDRMIEVNVHSPYHAAVEAGRKMHDNGRIIVIGSVNGDRVPFAGGAAYSLTKSAIQSMVRGLARDFGHRGITVNNIQPGPTLTDMTQDLIDRVLPHVPVGRVAAPSEIAAMVAYLAGDEAGYITGASLTIDGGMSL